MWIRVCCLSAALLMSSGCSTQALLADALATQGQNDEDDLQLAREASAFYLKLSESVLRDQPGHGRLAIAVTGGFTQYAYAFVAFEAERLESQDAKAAKALRNRAARLYARAQGHALRALEAQRPGFAKALAAPDGPPLAADQVGLAYWGAAAWAGRISLSKDQPELVADLPLALRLAQLAWAREPGFGDGDLASLMGTLEMARPGGQRAQAQAYFERARAAGAGRNAGVFVAQAEALGVGDRAEFEALLRQALVAADAKRDLGNTLMRERAQWLLDTADDRF
jgi:hypothetical protein